MNPRLSILALLASACMSPAFAYETDVHYGLTYWLAMKAGFADPHTIARANEKRDHGSAGAPHQMLIETCKALSGNLEDASKAVREMHFRSDEVVPKKPNKRKVAAAGAFASRDVADRADGKRRDVDDLYKFGQELHGFQDSFSHEGESSTVAGCSDDWVWAHPDKRGGAAKHDADFTHNDVDAAVLMAQKTYEYLRRYRDKHSGSYTDNPKDWSTLKRDVEQFAKWKTKQEKEKWFNEQEVPQATSIAKETNLDAGSTSAWIHFAGAPRLNLDGNTATAEAESARAAAELNARFARLRSENAAPPAVRAQFEKFVVEWLAGRDIAVYLGASVSFGSKDGSRTQMANVLDAMRVVDHSRVLPNGHGIERVSNEFQRLPPNTGIEQALIQVLGQPYFVLKSARKTIDAETYIATVRLIHAPQDLLLYTLVQAPSGVLIRDLTIVVIH